MANQVRQEPLVVGSNLGGAIFFILIVLFQFLKEKIWGAFHEKLKVSWNFCRKTRQHALGPASRLLTDRPRAMLALHISILYVYKYDWNCRCTSKPSSVTVTMYDASFSTKLTFHVKFRHLCCNWLYISSLFSSYSLPPIQMNYRSFRTILVE